ncbi:MAG: SCO family protein [candidate division Zixibacteria bacterium]|nr:SCO family protein [candidate division Zixibacteria bacterium]
MKRCHIHCGMGLLAAVLAFEVGASSAESPGLDASAQPRVLTEVGITQRVGTYMPGHLSFKDDQGSTVTLEKYFNERPVLLAMVYYECPMLCTEVLNGLVRSIAPLSFKVGQEFDVVAVSINPKETPELAAQKKAVYVERYGKPQSVPGWHFLTGEEASIRALADSIGFRYTYDPATGQFAHGSAILVATPEGRIAQYYFGIEYSSADLRLSIVEASQNRLGSIYDQVLLYCFHYDPEQGKYGIVIMNVIRMAGVATVLAMGSFMLVMFRRDRRAKSGVQPPSDRI